MKRAPWSSARRILARVALATAIVASTAALASAASPKPTTGDVIRFCLEEQNELRLGKDAARAVGPDQRRSCIFKGVAHCLDRAGPGSEIACYEEEAGAWDAILNETYRRIRAKASPKVFAPLQAHQRTWIAFRDAMCQRFYEPEGVTSLAQSAERACLAKETAYRALALQDILDDLTRAGD